MATIATKRNYQPYEESERVRQARAALDAQNAARPGAYQSGYRQQLEDLYRQITERQPFTYDMNADPVYRQYKDQYVRQGKQAMQHTIGQAAALTGGYGNSYAQSAGQQAYNAYLEQLGAVVPELYGQAQEQYNREGDEMRANYGLLSDREAQDYARYSDEFNRYLNERDYLAAQARDEADADFARWQDEANREYQAGRDAEADRQWQKDYERQLARDAENVRQWNEQLAYEREKDAEANRQWNESFAYQKESDAADRAYRQSQFDYQKESDAADRAYRQSQFDYQKESDAADRAYRQEQFAYQKSQDALDRERQAARDAESDRQWQESFGYQKERDTTKDSQWQKEFDEQVRQFNAQMAARSSGGGGGGGGRSGGGSGSKSGSGSTAGSGKSPTTQEYKNMEAAARKGEANLDSYLDIMQEKYGLSYNELMKIKSQYTKYFPQTNKDVYNGQRGATGYYV